METKQPNNMNKNLINDYFSLEELGTPEFLLGIYNGAAVTPELVAMVKEIANTTDDAEDATAINAASDEEISAALSEFIMEQVEDIRDEEHDGITSAADEYFWDHCNEDGYNSRRDYYNDIRDMAEYGVDDSLMDFCLDYVYEEVEIQYHTEEEVSNLVEGTLNETAKYAWETMD